MCLVGYLHFNKRFDAWENSLNSHWWVGDLILFEALGRWGIWPSNLPTTYPGEFDQNFLKKWNARFFSVIKKSKCDFYGLLIILWLFCFCFFACQRDCNWCRYTVFWGKFGKTCSGLLREIYELLWIHKLVYGIYKLKTQEYFLSGVAIIIVLSLKCFIYTCLNPLVTAHSFRVYFHKTIPEKAQVIHSRTTTQDCHLRTHQL